MSENPILDHCSKLCCLRSSVKRCKAITLKNKRCCKCILDRNRALCGIHHKLFITKTQVPSWVSYVLYDQLRVIKDVFNKHDITFWLGWGTLLGAVRHRGLIPWDDDADINVDIRDREKIKNLKKEFANLGFCLDCTDITNFQLTNEFLPDESSVNNPGDEESPGTDICFYTKKGNKYLYNIGGYKDSIQPFPVRQVPFGNFKLPIPPESATKKHLDQFYEDWELKIVIDPYHMDTMPPRLRRVLRLASPFTIHDTPTAPTQKYTSGETRLIAKHSQWRH